MEIRKEINGFYELADMVWSGAVDTITDIQNANKENEFMDFLEMVFMDREEPPTETEVNDFIWFEREYIYEHLGLTEDGELPEDEMEVNFNKSIKSLENKEEFVDFCNDCDTCIFGNICSTYDDCEAMFEDYKNQVITIDDIKEKVEEKTDINIWR